ncbi:MAG TPA: transposase [Gaiellaceae bacterium]|nr:transposase [Gaiellaceae bacterium]
MGRAPRINVVDGIYHLTARGVRRAPIYEDGLDYQRFQLFFREVAGELGWACHSFCQMPNHYHLLVETRLPNLSAGMQQLNWRHAVRFNWRHGYTGHLFESRFHSELIETEAHFLETARYIVLNPVRAGLCTHPADWPFSSYRRTLVPGDPVVASSRLLAHFGNDPEKARGRYEAFVAEGVASSRVLVPGTRTRLDQPKPYVPAKRSARSRTRRAAGSPTTLR